MAIEVIGTIKPKNGGKFPVAESEDILVKVLTKHVTDMTNLSGDMSRYSYPVPFVMSLGDKTGYRINKVGVKATAGATIRFALYELQRNEDKTGILRQIDVMGEAVADATGIATLTFEDGYDVRQDNTVVMALAEEAVIRCLSSDNSSLTVPDQVYFDDANYFGSEDGTEISCTYGTSKDVGICFAIWHSDIDFFLEQTLEEYIKDSDKRLDEKLAELKASGEFNGRGVEAIARTSGDGSPGTDDTYTILYSDGTTYSFTIHNGSDGKKGDKGDKGDPGKSPVVGVDYFTEEDKEEIVAAVLAALPSAEGGSF